MERFPDVDLIKRVESCNGRWWPIPYGAVVRIEIKSLGSPKHHNSGFLGPDWRREGANVPDSAGLTLNLLWANEILSRKTTGMKFGIYANASAR